MKLAPLHTKSWRHVDRNGRLVDNAIAPAMRLVLNKKYVAMAPTSGFGGAKKSNGATVPPSHRYTAPVAPIVITAAEALKIVRYIGYGCLTLYVHCVKTPATAIRTASCGPRRSSDIRFAAYDTDSVAPLATVIGKLTFHVDVTHATPMRTANIT